MKNIFIIAFLFIALLIASCKKYPDGPLLSLYTKKHRIMGTWDVDYFSINGYDSTAYLKSWPFYGMYDFGKGRSDTQPPAKYATANSDYSLFGNWSFYHDKEEIQISFSSGNYMYPNKIGPYRAKLAIWEIRRLTENELWLKTIYSDGKEYFVKFKLFKNYN